MTVSNGIIEIAILSLTIATLVGMVTRRLRLPYTLGLVLMGLAIGLVNRLDIIPLPVITEHLIGFAENISPEIILGLLVTPLIFEAAFHLNWKDLQRDLLLILALAIPGVIFTTVLVGVIIYAETYIAGTAMNFQIALIFGAMMAATDPVSVVALFRSLGVPKRLQVLMEGESLFNDGTAIVVFSLVLSIALNSSGTNEMAGIERWIKYLADFMRVSGGGLLIGLFLGWLVSQIIRKIDDALIETTLTIVLAFGTFIIAESINMSGILAVVMAGLISGNIGPNGMSPTTHILVTNFWEIIAFLSNSMVFLIIGLEIHLTELFDMWQQLLLAIFAVLLARAIVIYGLTWIGKNTPWRWRHILFWGGLRGAISLALAISLPFALGIELRAQLQNMAFGVVLFTLLVQGFTMQPLVRWLKLAKKDEMEEEYERRHARAVAARAAYEHLNEMHQEGLFSEHTWDLLAPMLKDHSNALAGAVKEILEIDPTVEAEELEIARQEALRAQRSTLIGLLTAGIITEDIYSQLSNEINLELSKSQTEWLRYVKEPAGIHPQVKQMMAAIVQIQDVENVIAALNQAGISVSRLSSKGGFLGRRNVTLLIGVSDDQEKEAVAILNVNCRRRVEYPATPLEGSALSLPLSTPVTVGGATVFTIEIEHYEEL
jgi:CPA1 family monovalent cation:H+ antiporter